MKIILYKDVSNLGEEGDTLDVADGYARNYLIPKKMAVPYTKASRVELEQKQRAINLRKEEKQKAARNLKERLDDTVIELSFPAGDKGRLFGSVTAAVIAESLMGMGMTVDRKKIEISEGGIKTVGVHTVKVKLYKGETAQIKVDVAAMGVERKAPKDDVKNDVEDEIFVDVGEEADAETEDKAESSNTAADGDETEPTTGTEES